jgi:hypothetical protein
MSVIKDKHSTEWLKVEKYCDLRLVEMHTDNEGDLDPVETARIRGMIQFAREILSLGVDDNDPLPVDDVSYT